MSMNKLLQGVYDDDPRARNTYKVRHKKKSRKMMDPSYLGQAGRSTSTYIKP